MYICRCIRLHLVRNIRCPCASRSASATEAVRRLARARKLTLTEAVRLRGGAGARRSRAIGRRSPGGHSRAHATSRTDRRKGRQGVLRPGMGGGQVTETLMVETSALVAVHSGGTGLAAIRRTHCRRDRFHDLFQRLRSRACGNSRESDAVGSSSDRAESARRLHIEVRDYASPAISYAIDGRERFGRGRRVLNMGDCLSYGAARQSGAHLIYVNEDFAQTDVNDRV